MEEEEGAPRLYKGKDELNLAEFPLSSLANRLDPDQKSMSFEDRVWDKSRGEMVLRQLTISPSTEYGFPTALDDEILLGLVQLSRLQGFANRKVTFSRYQLIQMLGWPDATYNYERIEQSLNRWVGVTLYYRNAWRNRADQSWADEKFHILDNVTLFDQERRSRHLANQDSLPLSTFTWNEVMFRSFQAGNMKSLDFEFFKRLESPVSKRLYRFLDKRFHFRERWDFNLKELCWAHVGLARSYDAANLKRRLRPAIAELEDKGFLKPMPDEIRFRRISSGQWTVVFEKAKAVDKGTEKPTSEAQQDSALVKALMDRGVTSIAAQETAACFPAERVQRHLEIFDWLIAQRDSRALGNPPGFLIASIRGEFTAPKEFNERQDRADKERRASEARRRREERETRRLQEEREKESARAQIVIEFWDQFTGEDRVQKEAEALAQATKFQRDLLSEGGSLAETTRNKLFEDFALRSLEVPV